MPHPWNNPTWQVRRAAVRDLAERLAETPDVWPRLLAAAGDPDAAVREAVVVALSGWQTTDQARAALAVFRERAFDPDEAVRRVAVEAPGRMGQTIPEAAEGVLGMALQDDSEEVRTAAAASLGRFDGTSAGVLRQALRDPARPVRREALRALGRHAPADAVPEVLAAALEPDVADAAAGALAHLARRHPEVKRGLLVGWGQCGPQRRRLLAQALAEMWSASALVQLRRWLRHPRPNWRWRAWPLVEWFLPLDPTLAEECAAALDDSHVRVRLAALRAVRSLGRAALPAVPRLIRRRFDGDRRCRALAALALAYLAEYCSPEEANLLCRLAQPAAVAGDVVREVTGTGADLAEFRAACERRHNWHARHGRGADEQESDAEHAWQLACWWTLQRERESETGETLR